jgi:L-threonylcarbamoyladenylate synthase
MSDLPCPQNAFANEERVVNTLILKVSPSIPEPERIAQAAAVIRSGGLVAFPTETVYGLGADGLDEAAVRRIFAAKGRPEAKGLILHLCEPEQAADVAEVSAVAEQLMAAFFPGPLTLVLRARPVVPAVTTGGGATVAVRMPDHPVAQALIRAAGRPIAAPSANPSGAPAPRSAAEVLAGLEGKFDLLLDAGPTALGTPSTVLDLSGRSPRVLRLGAVAPEAIEQVLGVQVLMPSDAPASGPNA